MSEGDCFSVAHLHELCYSSGLSSFVAKLTPGKWTQTAWVPLPALELRFIRWDFPLWTEYLYHDLLSRHSPWSSDRPFHVSHYLLLCRYGFCRSFLIMLSYSCRHNDILNGSLCWILPGFGDFNLFTLFGRSGILKSPLHVSLFSLSACHLAQYFAMP